MAAGDATEGAFLTDGEHLFQVLRTFAPNGQVMLEDCAHPERPCLVVTVRDLIRDGLTVVRPLREGSFRK